MVEVLVSALVLSIGVIGGAAMQLTALRTSQQSAFQTTAAELAADLADRMRANSRVMGLRDRENPFLGIDYSTSAEPAAAERTCHGNAECDARQLARFEIHEWQRRFQAAFPLARAVVCRDRMPWDGSAGGYKWECTAAATEHAAAPLVIKIGWRARNPDGGPPGNDGKHFPPALALIVEPYVR